MDSSKRFRPKTVLLWEKVVDDPEAQRILTLFPSADTRVIKKQRYAPSPDTPASHALLTGKRTLMIGRTSSFVGYFDGELGSGVCCRPYYKLVPLSNGCPFYCTYCYLAFIYRKYAPFIKININYETMFKQIRRAVEGSGNRISFNLGEMLDSLALDHITNLTTTLIPFFSKFSNAHLMLLTKSNNIDNLLTLEPNPQTVVSWSLNSREMIETHELGAATLGQRIEAAKACQDHGYRIRLRIDPGILHAN
jgi:spore photoproduct lyase